MKTVLTAIAICTLLLGATTVNADEPAVLDQMGLGDMAVVPDAEGLQVRGKGGTSYGSDLWPFILERETAIASSLTVAKTFSFSKTFGAVNNFDLQLSISRSNAVFSTIDINKTFYLDRDFAAYNKLVFVGPRLPSNLPR